MDFAERYGLVFEKSNGRASMKMISPFNRVFRSLLQIGEFHISECEMIVEEIGNAQNGLSYERNFLFDSADPDLELENPNVKFYDLVISMDDFKGILIDWVEFNKNSTLNVSRSFKYKLMKFFKF